MNRERNYGIDLLRMVCMFMICILHVQGQGGAMTRSAAHLPTYYTLNFLESACYCAVNTYGLISGYVGVRSHQRPSRLAELWLRVIWYSGLGTLLGVFVFHLPVEEDTLFKAVFPTLWGTYWYFSAYAGVFVIAPYLGRMAEALSGAQRRRLMLSLFILCSCLTIAPRISTTTNDFLNLNAGYSFAWLSVLYAEGACLRLETEEKEENSPSRRGTAFYLMLYFVCTALSWGSKNLIENHTRAVYGQARYGSLLQSYMSPTMVLCAYALVMIFSRMKIRGEGGRAAIRFLSPLAFSVYLVQLQPYFWKYVLKGRFLGFTSFYPPAAVAAVLLWALILYLLCSGIDLIRAGLFRVLKLRQRLERLTDVVLRPLRKITG